MKKYLILLLLSFFAFGSYAQWDDGGETTVEDSVVYISDTDTASHQLNYQVYDVSEIQERKFDQEKLTEHRLSGDFDYDQQRKPQERPNWQGKFFFKVLEFMLDVLEWIGDVLTTPKGDFSWIFYVVMIVCLLAVTFIIVRFFVGTSLFSKRKGLKSKDGLDYDIETEDIYAMDFNVLLEEALAKQLYRRAVRILFLKTLKEMADAEVIQWEENKTNLDYIYEIKSAPLQQSFEYLSDVFDYIWYGEKSVDKQQFLDLQQTFSTFSKQINK
ncbi:MAG: DUF4129 domain-containing protein [Cytophagales bacterium]|nr:DUF4129 domain-containing protein [Cytophagales bacterium]